MSHPHPVHDLHAHPHDHHGGHAAPLHPPPHAEGCETANKDHFGPTAHQYNERPDVQRRAEEFGTAMKKTGLFKQGVTTVMDFACGTGLISRVLAAETKLIVGVDISQGMVNQYNKIVNDHGIPPEEMNAICTTPDENKLQGMTFDVIVCASAYHHFPSIDEVTNHLVTTYLNPGGSLLVADLVRGETTHEIFPKDHTVSHRGGFTEDEIRSTFEKAGLKNITFDIVMRAKAKHSGHPVELFLARGDKQ